MVCLPAESEREKMKIYDILRKWGEAQEEFLALPCPRCGRNVLLKRERESYTLSREADIYICSTCAKEEKWKEEMRKGEFTSKDRERELSSWYCVKVERGNDYE